MPYLMYDLSARLGNRLPGLARGIPIHQEYRATEFNGSTAQALVFYYNPPRCLKVLDYTADSLYPNKPDLIVQAMPLSRLELIQPGSPSSPEMPALFGPEPAHTWCYYFEKIDLAVQLKQWDRAARLADAALQTKPDWTRANAAEILPLVTAYAQAGRYDRAVELSLQSGKLSDKLSYGICDLWYRLGQSSPNNPGFHLRQPADRPEFPVRHAVPTPAMRLILEAAPFHCQKRAAGPAGPVRPGFRAAGLPAGFLLG